MTPKKELALLALKAFVGAPIQDRLTPEALDRWPGVWEAVVEAVTRDLRDELKSVRADRDKLIAALAEEEEKGRP